MQAVSVHMPLKGSMTRNGNEELQLLRVDAASEKICEEMSKYNEEMVKLVHDLASYELSRTSVSKPFEKT